MADAGKCFWCGVPLPYRDVQIDHVFPERLAEKPELDEIKKSYGLGTEFDVNCYENWVTSHQGCNLRKRAELLPNSSSTLFVVGQVQARANKLRKYQTEFEKNRKRERVLSLLRAAVDAGSVTEADIKELISGLPTAPRANDKATATVIKLDEKWSIVPGSPLHQAAMDGWTIHHVSGAIGYVNDGTVVGIVPNVAAPHPTWECSRCGRHGPWDGIICRHCGNREAPDQ